MAEFVMPALGADMTAGTLVEWRRAVGDRVKRGDIIADVETEKGVIEVEVFTDGVIERFLVEPGTKVPVGTPMAVLREEGGETAAPAEPEVRTPPSPPPELPEAPRGVKVAYAGARLPDAARHDTPSARRLARESGLDISTVAGTGPHGRVTREDVERAVDAQAARAQVAVPPPGAVRLRVSPVAWRRAKELGVDAESVEPSSPDGVVHLRDVERAASEKPSSAADPQAAMRRAIAAAMSRSKREIPHYYLSHPVDLGPALDWMRAENERRGVQERLLPAVLLLRATILALGEVPELNARWTGESAPPLDRVHLGVAISLRGGGLIAPAIHDAQDRSLTELMVAFKGLVQRTRAGTIRGSELTDATITVTSLGDRGVETVLPIINPPQVAMVGFGRVGERPWVVDGEVVPRPVVTAALAGDHRVTDGHRGGLFLSAIERLLATPEEL